MPQLRVTNSEALCQGIFPGPLFGILEEEKLEPALFAALSTYGLRLSDMRFASEAASFAEDHLQCSLVSLATFVRVMLDRVDIHCVDTSRVDLGLFKRAVSDVLDVVQRECGGAYGSYNTTLALHGILDTGSPKDFLMKFTAGPPEGTGPPLAAGAAFYYGAGGEQTMSVISVDLSGVVKDGIFVKLGATWDAHKITSAALPDAAERWMQDWLSRLDLQTGSQTT